MNELTVAKQLDAPDFLEGVALETYNETAPMLYQLGIFEVTDVSCLSVYCECWSEWLDVLRQDDPDIDLMFKLTDTLLEYSNALGLNPASRLQILRNLEIVNAL